MKTVKTSLLLTQIMGAAVHPMNIRGLEDKYGRTLTELIDMAQMANDNKVDEIDFLERRSEAYLRLCNLPPLREVGEIVDLRQALKKAERHNEELHYTLKQMSSDLELARRDSARARCESDPAPVYHGPKEVSVTINRGSRNQVNIMIDKKRVFSAVDVKRLTVSESSEMP